MKLVISIPPAVALSAPFSAHAGGDPEIYRDYDSKRAGHPLRIVAYAVHPVGVILDRLIFRPAWWLGSFEPVRTLVGREPVLPETTLEAETQPDGA